MFKFGRSEAAKEQFAHQLAKKYDHDKGLNINDGHTRIRFGDVNHRRVELLPLVVGIADDGGRQGQAGSGQQRRPHPGGQRGRRIRQFVAFFFGLHCRKCQKLRRIHVSFVTNLNRSNFRPQTRNKISDCKDIFGFYI